MRPRRLLMVLSALSFILFAGPPDVSLLFGGDIMLNAVSPKAAPLHALAPQAAKHDAFFANLEIPLTNVRTATVRKTPKELKARDQYILKADPKHIASLKQAGITGVSLANNHAMDYGWRGLVQQDGALDAAGIPHAGAGKNAAVAARAATVAAGKYRVALISSLAFMSRTALWKCTPATTKQPGIMVLPFNGVINDAARKKLKSWIGTARKDHDLVVVALHWGLERKPVPSPFQVALGRACIDAGADIVWGHHSHVLQAAELYQGRPIMYSLGNLVSPTPAASALFSVRRTGGKWDFKVLPTRISGGRVKFSGSTADYDRRQRLFEAAFPMAE